jgi:hypothetical protein
MSDFREPGGIESLDSTRTLAGLRKEAMGGNMAAGLKYIGSSFSVFRGVMIALFVLLFIAALMGIISGGFLLVAADVDNHSDAWKSRARSMGGADIAIMFIFLAFSAYAIYIMVRYEKAMGFMLHRISTGAGGGVPHIKTTNEQLNMENAVSMGTGKQQYPQGIPTGSSPDISTKVSTPPQVVPASGFSFE